jgi:hypothetical protein
MKKGIKKGRVKKGYMESVKMWEKQKVRESNEREKRRRRRRKYNSITYVCLCRR